MSQFPNSSGFNKPQKFQLEYATGEKTMMQFFNMVYAWMCAGLAVTAVTAYVMATEYPQFVMRIGRGGLLLFLVEMGLVYVISGALNKISTTTATVLFMLFAALNGVSFAIIFMIFKLGTIASTFIICAGTFGAMSVYGMVTKRNLSTMGRILGMAVWGLIIASVVGIFFHNTIMQVIINYAGVLIFVGLTAADTQKLKEIGEATQHDPQMASRLAIVGSLTLYLDFVNLFIFLLRIVGGRRD